MNTVIFDLDGTLSDSAEGIVKSINYALDKKGFEKRPENELHKYIGPSLIFSFSELTGSNDRDYITEIIKTFRERYFSIGYKENVLYDGIREMIEQLFSNGNTLCIATTKRQDMAVKVLELFNIDSYFTQIHGSGLHTKKSELLKKMISDPTLNDRPMIMIGDRDTDFYAAKEVNMPSIAVRWGYGNEDEWKLATDQVEKPEELHDAIIKNALKIV